MESQQTGEGRRTDPRQAAEEVRQQSREALGQLGETGRGLWEEQRDTLIKHAGHVATALHDTAERLRGDGEGVAGNYVQWAADGLQRVSTDIGHKGFDEVLGGTADFIRRQPAVAIGGAVLIGLALSRFLKQSGHAADSHAESSPEHAVDPLGTHRHDPDLEEPQRTAGGLHARAEAEYGDLATRKPGSPATRESDHAHAEAAKNAQWQEPTQPSGSVGQTRSPAEAEYGELESRKPGAARKPKGGRR